MTDRAIGFIGLGIMGSLQAANLAKAGYELTVYNRTRSKADDWAKENGGTVVDSPREVAERSDVVITMVVDGPQVEDMVGQALEGAKPDTLFIDMSTIAPGTARALNDRLAQAGHHFLDAPVTGSSPKAKAGTLVIMVGGEESDLERARPLLEVMGEKIVHCGASGQGQAVKVIANTITAINAATLAQGLTVAKQAGVDRHALLEAMEGGSADSTMRSLKGKPMIEHDFTPLFKLAHMLKDVQLCLAETRTANSAFPFAGLAQELYGAGMNYGLADQDFSAIVKVVEGLNGL
jgi:3-hydroxyisobutyrate dehydrogenase-like beta-hydroxyacid dehydrogenase